MNLITKQGFAILCNSKNLAKESLIQACALHKSLSAFSPSFDLFYTVKLSFFDGIKDIKMLTFDAFNAIIKEKNGDLPMSKPKKSEKLFLEGIFLAGKSLQKKLKGLSVGQLIPLIRSQLGMSQRILAARAAIQQSSVVRIESGHFDPNISTLKKIVEAMECDLVITIIPRTDLKTTRESQAKLKAEQKIRYLHGTMSLEKQAPNQKLLKELHDEEVKNLLDSSGSALWDE